MSQFVEDVGGKRKTIVAGDVHIGLQYYQGSAKSQDRRNSFTKLLGDNYRAGPEPSPTHLKSTRKHAIFQG